MTVTSLQTWRLLTFQLKVMTSLQELYRPYSSARINERALHYSLLSTLAETTPLLPAPAPALTHQPEPEAFILTWHRRHQDRKVLVPGDSPLLAEPLPAPIAAFPQPLPTHTHPPSLLCDSVPQPKTSSFFRPQPLVISPGLSGLVNPAAICIRGVPSGTALTVPGEWATLSRVRTTLLGSPRRLLAAGRDRQVEFMEPLSNCLRVNSPTMRHGES